MYLDVLLKACSQKKSVYYSYDYFISKLTIPEDVIRNLLTSIPSLFDINSNNEKDKQIAIVIKLKACEEYNQVNQCSKKNSCTCFHICDSKLYLGECKKTKCQLLHDLKSKHNKRVLKLNNISAHSKHFMNFYRVFYSAPVSEKALPSVSKGRDTTFTNQIDPRILYLLNLSKSKKKMDVERYAKYITQAKVISCENWNSEDTWIIYFDTDINFEIALDNLERLKYQLPARLQIKQVLEADEYKQENEDQDPKLTHDKNICFLKQDSNGTEINIDYRKIALTKLKQKKSAKHVKEYVSFLTCLNPVSISKIPGEPGSWVIEFDQHINFNQFEANFEKSKTKFPKGLEFKTVPLDADDSLINPFDFFVRLENKMFYLINGGKIFNQSNIDDYVYDLTNLKAISIQKMDKLVWLVEFNQVIDFPLLTKNLSKLPSVKFRRVFAKVYDSGLKKHLNINYRFLYLMNLREEMGILDIKNYAFMLTKREPVFVYEVNVSNGIYAVMFREDLDQDEILINYNQNQNGYSSYIEYKLVYEKFIDKPSRDSPYDDSGFHEESIEGTNDDIVYESITEASSDKFFQIILDKIEWREQLFKAFVEKHNKADYDGLKLTIRSVLIFNKTRDEWQEEINQVLINFLEKYHMEIIEYEKDYQSIITEMMKNIFNWNNGNIQCLNKIEDGKLYLMGLVNDIEKFFAIYGRFRDLTRLYDNEKANRKMMSHRIEKSKIIKLENSSLFLQNYDLLVKLVEKLACLYKIKSYFINKNEITVAVKGLRQNIENFERVLKKSIASLKSREANFHSLSKELGYEKTKSILSNISNELKELSFKIDITSSMSLNILYFFDVVELKSVKDSTFDTVSNYLNNSILFHEFIMNDHLALLATAKWQDLMDILFRSDEPLIAFNFKASFQPKVDCRFIIGGNKRLVTDAQLKIINFLKSYTLVSHQKVVSIKEGYYLKFVAINFISSLELKYKAQISFEENTGVSFKINFANIHEGSIENLENEILHKISEMCVHKFMIVNIPGLKKFFDSSQLIDKISSLKNRHNCYILYEPSFKSVSKKIPTKEPIFNGINKTIKILNSTITLKTGDLVKEKSEVIVNTTSDNLNLDSGSLSSSILKAAGPSIQRQLYEKYQGSIGCDSVAVTFSGRLKNIQQIFHVVCPNLNDKSTCSTVILYLISIVSNCIKTLIDQRYKEISFPALATGNLKYPPNLVAKAMLEGLCDIILETNFPAINVKIVIFEKDTEIIKAFQQEFDNLNEIYKLNLKKSSLPNDISYSAIESSSEFEIIAQTDKLVQEIRSDLLKYLNERIIVSEIMLNQLVRDLRPEEIRKILTDFSNLEIKLNKDSIVLRGLDQEVQQAKINIVNMVNASISTPSLAQWQFDIEGIWENFGLELNRMIESGYASNQHVLNLNDTVIILFDERKLMNLITGKTICIHRLDLREAFENKQIIMYPISWCKKELPINLISIDFNSDEYSKFVGHFEKNATTGLYTIHRLERIENKFLYDQYYVYSQRLKKNNPEANEKYLFHGSNTESLNKIWQFGFNRSFAGKNGVNFGHGTYFGVDPAYADRYSSENTSKLKQMIRARVLIGNPCLGNENMKTLPINPTGKMYDSTCDTTKTIFACFHDCQSYPEYILTYSVKH